jgi:enolase
MTAPMPVITHLEALEILDGRGRPSLEVVCVLDEAVRAHAAVPGTRGLTPGQPAPLYDGEEDRHGGRGCRKAVAQVEGEIRAALVGKRFRTQVVLDKALAAIGAGSEQARAGANAQLGVSLAFARAGAILRGVPLHRHFADLSEEKLARLPSPIVALFGRNEHEPPDRGLLAVATVATGATSLDDALATSAAVRAAAERLLRDKYGAPAAPAPWGGLAAPFFDSDAMIADAVEAIRAAGREPARQLQLVLAIDGRRRHDSGWYRIDRERLTTGEVIDHLGQFADKFPIAALEDPLHEEDPAGFQTLRARVKGKARVVARDLTAADPVRIAKVAAAEAVDAVLLEPGRLATVSDAVAALQAARKARLGVVVASSDAETEDDWLADLAVGLGADYVQLGALSGAQNTAKYNRLLAIEKRNRWPVYRPSSTGS